MSADHRRAWLERARRLRQLAVGVDDPGIRQDLLDLASKWTKMAEQVGFPLPPAGGRNDD